jgi:hypothetical protein
MITRVPPNITFEQAALFVVDRSSRPTYPSGYTCIHTKLELTGPSKIYARDLNVWLHPKQIGRGPKGGIKGDMIYNHLISNGMLSQCAGLLDLLEIQARGPEFVVPVFGNEKALFGWRSVVGDEKGKKYVPYLFTSFLSNFSRLNEELHKKAVPPIRWRCLTRKWYRRSPALCYK